MFAFHYVTPNSVEPGGVIIMHQRFRGVNQPALQSRRQLKQVAKPANNPPQHPDSGGFHFANELSKAPAAKVRNVCAKKFPGIPTTVLLWRPLAS